MRQRKALKTYRRNRRVEQVDTSTRAFDFYKDTPRGSPPEGETQSTKTEESKASALSNGSANSTNANEQRSSPEQTINPKAKASAVRRPSTGSHQPSTTSPRDRQAKLRRGAAVHGVRQRLVWLTNDEWVAMKEFAERLGVALTSPGGRVKSLAASSQFVHSLWQKTGEAKDGGKTQIARGGERLCEESFGETETETETEQV